MLKKKNLYSFFQNLLITILNKHYTEYTNFRVKVCKFCSMKPVAKIISLSVSFSYLTSQTSIVRTISLYVFFLLFFSE